MIRISDSTVRRLSHYYRVLGELEAEGKRVVSSHRLAQSEGITSAQVRKDLSYFGSFGRRGLGYNVVHLRGEIRNILGLDRRWRVALVGAGHIGAALANYRGFERQGFDIVAVFDADPARVGTTVAGQSVRPFTDLAAPAPDEQFEIGIIATPMASAQEVADALVARGVRAILNFAPRKLQVPREVSVSTVDMTMELEGLSFALSRDRTPRRRGRI
jgi:redox-sensing transcriptional repressor